MIHTIITSKKIFTYQQVALKISKRRKTRITIFCDIWARFVQHASIATHLHSDKSRLPTLWLATDIRLSL